MLLPVEEWVEGAVVTLSVPNCVCVCEFILQFPVSFLLLLSLRLLVHRNLEC